MEPPLAHPGTSPSALVAGHICLDVIPRLSPSRSDASFQPGSLEIIGPATLAVGGSVGNTGFALHRLGVSTNLVARIGDDAFGAILGDRVRAAVPGASGHLVVAAGGSTSYSLVRNRPGEDRSIEHFPGVNASFRARDVPTALLREATVLHVGYPPLMAALVADSGHELLELLAAAHALGVITSLDMASPDRDPGDVPVPWPDLLRRVLPAVDVFLPSLDEAAHLLGRQIEPGAAGAPGAARPATLAWAGRLADEMLGLGVAIAGVKLGGMGLYLRTGTAARIAAMPRPPSPSWIGRELWSPVFETAVVGTTGAGDATIAGFLLGLLRGMDPAATLTAACAVGGFSTEAPDGTSGIPAWETIAERLKAGWSRVRTAAEPGWNLDAATGVWAGPRDAAARRR